MNAKTQNNKSKRDTAVPGLFQTQWFDVQQLSQKKQ
jgi:hypothetical protein